MSSAETFLDTPPERRAVMPSADSFLDEGSRTSLGNIMEQLLKPSLYISDVITKAFGTDKPNDAALGLNKETVDAMKSSGEWDQYAKDHLNYQAALKDGVVMPAASDMQAAFIRSAAEPFITVAKGVPQGIEAGWQNFKNFATMANLPTRVLDDVKARLHAGQPVNWKDYLGVFNESFTNSPPGQAMGAIFNPITGVLQPAFNEASQLLEKAGVPHQVTEFILNVSPLFGYAYSKLRPEPAPEFAPNEGPWGALRQTLTASQANDVIGDGIGEGQYMGTIGKTPEQSEASLKASWALPEEYQPPSIHEVARNIEPEVFKEYDALDAQRQQLSYSMRHPEEVFGGQIDAQIAGLKGQIAELARAPLDLPQDELDRVVQENNAKAIPIEAQLKELQANRAQMIQESAAQAQQEFFKADYRMRDLSPQVSAAYREAQGRNIDRFPTFEEGSRKLETPVSVAADQAKSLVDTPGSVTPDRVVAQGYARGEDVEYQEEGQTKAQLFARAEANKENYAAFIKQLTSDVNGAEPYAEGVGGDSGVRVKKTQGRIDQKIEDKGGDAAKVSDYLGGAIEVANPKALQEVLQRIEDSGKKVIEVEDMLTSDDKYKNDGYRAIHMQVELEPGFSAELQLLPKGVAQIKEQLHPEYVKLRNVEEGGEEFTARQEQARETLVSEYDKAFKKFTGESAEPAKITIAGDLSKKLVAAGRPQEEADAAGQLVQAHYEARAERFDGKLGTAQEMYERDGAEIKAGKSRVRARELAQADELEQTAKGKIRLATDDAKATITLMKSADASTFIHETGHHWLDELMNDASLAEAPDDLKADAATVRRWLGVNEGDDIPTKAHEKFARGFERYMMEGTAPSRGLATVFAQFKSWLTSIYQTVDRLRSPVNDDIRQVFDRLLAKNPEKIVIAPEQEPGNILAAVHERDAVETPVALAASVRDRIEGEIDHTAKLHEPEVHDVVKTAEIRSDTEARGVETPASSAGEAASGSPGIQSAGEESDQIATIGSDSGAESASARADVYAKVPKEPLGLTDWIKKNGGIKDEGGDIRSALGGAKYRPGLIKKSGLPAEEAALRAWEAGYFPELTERPSVNDLLDRLGEDLRGNKQYSANDAEAVTSYNDALAHNRDIDETINKYGIDTAGKTAAQLADLLNEKISEAERDKLIAGQDAAAQAEMEDFERRQKEWLASRGEAWEPEEVKTRTEADLEREWQQEKAAAKLLPSEGRLGAAGTAERHEGAGAINNGQGATGSPAAGRPQLVDKAGNIRLDLLNTPDDINSVIRQTAAENNDFIQARRGTISNGQTLELAEALGVDPAFLDTRRIGQAFNAEQIVAGTKLLIQSAADVREAMESGDVEAYLEAKARHQMIQAQVSGFTAEAGRALQIFQSLKKMEGYDQAKLVNDFLDQTDEGKTLFQIQEEMNFGKNLTTPEQVSKFIHDSSQHSFRNMVLEYYVNSLISGPITHLRYAVGNALKALWTPLVETPIAATIGEIREALGDEGERVYYGESLAQLHGLLDGSVKGWQAAMKAFDAGYSEPLPAEKVSADFMGRMTEDYAIPGQAGEIINLPGKSVAAIHSFFKAMRYEQNIQSLAYRTATEEGLEGDAFTDRIAELSSTPTADMMEIATKDSLKQLYMAPTDYHSLTGILTRATNKYLLAKIMVPFMKIGGQITREAFIESTPLGFFDSDVNANLMGENGPTIRDMQAARMTAGVSLIGATVMLTAQGRATGDGPDDPAQRRVWLLTHKPNSIQVGDITIPYQGLGSLGMLMRFAANMTETAKQWDKKDGIKLAESFIKGISKSVLDENFMRGVNDFLEAAYHPDEYGAKYIKSFATNWLPFSVGMGQTAREIDPYHREAKTIFEAARAKIPFLSKTLYPMRDIFGLPIPNGKPITDYANDPVVQRMNALQIGVGKLEDKIRGVQLNEKQYDDYQRIAGNLAKARLDKVVAQEKFTSLPQAAQIDLIHKTISEQREMARALILKQYPELLNEAIAAKRIKKEGR